MPSRLSRGAAALLIVVGCMMAIVPFAPIFPAFGLDEAWKYAVNAAVAQHLVFGRDLIFTFGPYASVYTLSFHPGTDTLAMVASLLLALALAGGLLALTPERARWRGALLAVLLSTLWLRDPLFFAIPLVFLAVVAQAVAVRATGGRLPWPALALLVVALALLPLIKGTFAAGVAVALGIASLLLLIRGRLGWMVANGVLFAAALSAFWLGSHQPLAGLPGFFTAQSEIVAGYTEAMALPGPPWQVAVFGVAALAVLVCNVPAARRAGLAGVAVLGGAFLLMLLAFKAGFVRQDAHIVIAGGSLGLIAGVLTLAHRGKLPALGMVIGLVAWAVLQHAAEGLGPRSLVLRIETAYRQAGAGLVDRLQGGRALAQGYADALETIRRTHPLPALTGTADTYSAGQSVLLAFGITWDPRPVLQSYSAYSPALEGADARHLTGASAPSNLVFTLQPIDDRLPALEDGQSWLPILARYQATRLLGDTALLQRRPVPLPASLAGLEPASNQTLNQPVPLDPARGPLWAVIDVRPTWLGRLLAAVFRPPPLHITMHLASGKAYSYRFVAGMGRAGFVISPLIGTAAQLLALQLPGPDVFADHLPASFSLEGDPVFWDQSYAASFTPLHVPPWPGFQDVLFQQPKPAAVAGKPGGECWFDMVDGHVLDHAKPVNLAGLTRLTGWGFVDAEPARPPDSVRLVLQGGGGTVLAMPAVLQPRQDVAAHFHDPQLEQVGFQALVDLRSLAGRYNLALELTQAGHHLLCPLLASVTIN